MGSSWKEITTAKSNITQPLKRKVVVIGGGPVGTLAALYFSKANWNVEIHELRPGELKLRPGLVT